MSKRDLKKYLDSLTKEQISEQFLELYGKFQDVKTYYDFVFNPKEEQLVTAAKAKIRNEYFPVKTKRAKLRRSTAQKIIKHFMLLGVDAVAIADVMLYNIEIAVKYSSGKQMRYASFYKSMYSSMKQLLHFASENVIVSEFRQRIEAVLHEVTRQNWENADEMMQLGDLMESAH